MMAAIPSRMTTVELGIRFLRVEEGVDAVECLACRAPLDLHQPDAQRPERLLGTCDSCGAWHLLESVDDSMCGLLILLPAADALAREDVPELAIRP